MATDMTDVRVVRQQLGLSQVELAGALGVRQATISRLENGHKIDKRTALALEALLIRQRQAQNECDSVHGPDDTAMERISSPGKSDQISPEHGEAR
ncbi:XRE family transcriptional regulator [Sphingomonas sp. BHC-A]|nr:XRE family transcriptional regulator [Sphingomonas sp. BHC-A]